MMTSHRLFKGVVVVLAALLVALMGLAPSPAPTMRTSAHPRCEQRQRATHQSSVGGQGPR